MEKYKNRNRKKSVLCDFSMHFFQFVPILWLLMQEFQTPGLTNSLEHYWRHGWLLWILLILFCSLGNKNKQNYDISISFNHNKSIQLIFLFYILLVRVLLNKKTLSKILYLNKTNIIFIPIAKKKRYCVCVHKIFTVYNFKFVFL